MRISHILEGKSSDVFTVDEGVAIREALSVLAEKRIGAVIVTSAKKAIAGVLSERDIIRALGGGNESEILGKPVSSIMTSNVFVCSPSDGVSYAMEMMTEKRFRHLPVMTDGKLIGMISIGDVVKAKMQETQQESEALKTYIATG